MAKGDGTGAVRRMRIWPAVVGPLGLTFLLGAATWLFVNKVQSDQEEREAAALRLEGYARVEAADLANRAQGFLTSFVEERAVKRREQERSLRTELRALTDNLYRLLTANLEKSRANAVARREVGDFPSGFEGVKHYLEIAGGGKDRADPGVEALRACANELGALLPAGGTLTVVRNNFEELLALGGGDRPENALTEGMSRDFMWEDAGDNRNWTLQVRLSAPDENPTPTAAELAAHLSEKLGASRLANVVWRGWLVGTSGQAAAYFPAGVIEDAPPFINRPGEWVDIEGRRLVWLERRGTGNGSAARLNEAPGEYSAGVSVSIDRPASAPTIREEFERDGRWALTLAALSVLSVIGWAWFFWALWGNRRRLAAESRASLYAGAAGVGQKAGAAGRMPDRPDYLRDDIRAVKDGLAAKTGAAAKVQRGLSAGSDEVFTVKGAPPRRAAAGNGRLSGDTAGAPGGIAAGGGERPAREAQAGGPPPRESRESREEREVIVADIDADGVHIRSGLSGAAKPAGDEDEEPVLVPAYRIPSGSLFRLQERHRGGRGRAGSMVLDQARSQLLRELAKRVRPAAMFAKPMPAAVVQPAGVAPVMQPVVEPLPQGRRSSGRVTEVIPKMKSPGGWERVD